MQTITADALGLDPVRHLAVSDDEVRRLHQLAVRGTIDVVGAITPDAIAAGALDRPTPCAGWDVRHLLVHMTTQQRGFAAALAGADHAAWIERPLGPDPAVDYAAAAEAVLAAFAEPGVFDAPVALPDISTVVTFAGRAACCFHLVDDAVHGWDVATALGTAWRPDDEVAALTLRIALALPNGEERRRPGAAFATGHDPGPDADAFTRVLALLGR